MRVLIVMKVFLPLALVFSCLGCEQSRNATPMAAIRPVGEYLVNMAGQVGDWTSARARVLADAIKLAWRKLVPEVVGNVTVDANDPLKGRMRGTYRSEIRPPEGHMLAVEFDNPIMERPSLTSSEWTLSILNYPESLRELVKAER